MYDAIVPASFVKPLRPPLIKSVISEANRTSEKDTANHVATNFFSHTKQYISLQLTTSPHPHPHPHAQSYFSSLTQRQVRAWSSLLLQVVTNPQHSVAGLLPIYTTLPPPPPAALAHAQALAAQMRQRLQHLSLDTDSIRASPHLYLPWMWHILQYVEPLAAAHVRGSKLFTMVPQCGNQAQHITITSTCLHRCNLNVILCLCSMLQCNQVVAAPSCLRKQLQTCQVLLVFVYNSCCCTYTHHIVRPLPGAIMLLYSI